MTIQFSFYATERDDDLIASELLSVFGTLYAMPDWRPLDEMVPSRASTTNEVAKVTAEGTHYLFEEAGIENAVIDLVPRGVYCVEYRDCACLEYDPCIRLVDGTVRIGRFAYFYTEDDEFRKKVQRLFRRLRRHAQKLPKSFAWIFEDAAQSASRLCDMPYGDVDDTKPNPLFRQK